MQELFLLFLGSVFEFAYFGRYVNRAFLCCLFGVIMTKFLSVGFVLASSFVGSAFAAVPPEVTSAIADMKTDGLVVASAVLVAVIAIAAIKFLRRAM